MTIKEYKSPIIAKQPGHLQKQHLWNVRACCVHTQKHPSYKSILFKYKKQSSFPRSSVYAAPVLWQNLPKAWGGGVLLSPRTVIPTPGASPEGQRVETQGPRRETCWEVHGGGHMAAGSTVRAHRIFLSPGNRDPGGEPACSPLFLGKQKSGTCLSQLSRSLKNKKRESD